MASSSQSKTVLLLIETLNRGGIENVLLRLIPKLKQEGWESVVVTLRDGGEMLHEYEKAGICVIALNQGHFLSPILFRLINQQIKIIQPDLIMTNLFKADAVGRLWLRFTTRRPVVPYLVTTYNHHRYWLARVFEWLTKPLASAYIANSKAVQAFYETRLGVRPGKITVVPNGVDTDVFQAADGNKIVKELQLPKHAIVITCVANLAANKGQADLLAAFESRFAHRPEVFLLLVGDGAEREKLTQQHAKLEAKERIVFLGRRTDVPDILKATTVFCLPTFFEGMSTALLEAMAAHKAIVTTNIPENKVLLTPDVSALMVSPGDREALAQSLQTLVDNQDLRRTLSQSAYQAIVGTYSMTQVAHNFAATFSSLSQKSNKAGW